VVEEVAVAVWRPVEERRSTAIAAMLAGAVKMGEINWIDD
jgi:hypothetical protein